jgi:hypothetical protein
MEQFMKDIVNNSENLQLNWYSSQDMESWRRPIKFLAGIHPYIAAIWVQCELVLGGKDISRPGQS